MYRGTLPDGQEVAVKVRSATSTQGTREFNNEVSFILLSETIGKRLLFGTLKLREKLKSYLKRNGKRLYIVMYAHYAFRTLDFLDLNFVPLTFKILPFSPLTGYSRSVILFES